MPRNFVNVRANAPLPVAILGSSALDVSLVDVDSLAFGPAGAAPIDPPLYDDVNGDGFVDLVTRYRIGDTGIEAGDTSACLTGALAGTPFTTCQAIVTGPPFPGCGLGDELLFALVPLAALGSRLRGRPSRER